MNNITANYGINIRDIAKSGVKNKLSYNFAFIIFGCFLFIYYMWFCKQINSM